MAGHVVVVGAGNIGSHLIEHLARMPAVSRITVADPGRYEAKNVQSQRVDRDDVGRAKVYVQAARIRRIDPGVDVVAIAERVQDVPLGKLRGDVIVAALDNWRARQHVNEAARRLGVRWIDAGVQGEGMLARVNVYSPAEESACLECSWGPRDYELLEQVRPCADPDAPPTNAPSALGALAAALEAIEVEKLLRGEETVLGGRQALLDARHHTHFVTSFRRSASCRLADHAPWRIETVEPVADATTLGELVATLAPGASSLEVFGGRFVRALRCPGCGQRVAVLRVTTSRASGQRCSSCGGELVATAFDTVDTLDLASLPDSEKALPVRDLGIRDGDVLVLGRASGVIRRCEVSLVNHSLVHQG